MSLTRSQLKKFVERQTELGTHLDNGFAINKIAEELGFRFSQLGQMHAVMGMIFWQTPFGDVMTDGLGTWELSES